MRSRLIGLLAVGLVTYMILWMRSHARGLKKHLEGATAGALATSRARRRPRPTPTRRRRSTSRRSPVPR